ncbi:MAG: tyrosine-type recombinase/integrase [Clostridiales bacterium]|nr:tyrosine-type recombinase/integrase [Clostridiales bacterium]
MRTTDPIKNPEDVDRMMAFYLQKENFNLRNALMIALGLYTALRISDILELEWSDVLKNDGKVRERIVVIEKKTKKENIIAVNKKLKKAILSFAQAESVKTGYIFKGGRDKRKHLHRTQAYRIIKAAAEALDLEGTISCHSLRKTVGYHLYLSGASAILLMNLYNHSSFNITKRYLRISQFEKDEAFLNLSY